jgi:hemerythrin
MKGINQLQSWNVRGATMAAKTAFEWDATKYTTYVTAMDQEHEKLVLIMNRLFTENESGAPKSKLLQTIEDLGKWTTTHFAHEEAFFSKMKDYKSIDTHKRIHQTLLENFATHAAKFKAEGDRVPQEFFLFLKVWLTAHICGIDRKYGELVKAG